MAQAELPQDHLSDYERAVCYYALPRTRHPLTFGLIAAYAVCLLEAVGAVAYGLFWDSERVLYFGIYAFGTLVFFGVIVFFMRALIDDVRRLKLLNQARKVPDAPAHLQDLPNPFENHVLLRRPAHAGSALYACTEADATIQYLVDVNPDSGHWRIKTPQDVEVCSVKVVEGPASFQFTQDLPRRISISAGEKQLGQIRRRFSFDTAVATIEPADKRQPKYTIRRSGVYLGDRLVGRLYHLRGSYYLDIEKKAFSELVVAYFVTVT